ncbi:MAG: hypothetical protein V1692_02830 [bacterium]
MLFKPGLKQYTLYLFAILLDPLLKKIASLAEDIAFIIAFSRFVSPDDFYN